MMIKVVLILAQHLVQILQFLGIVAFHVFGDGTAGAVGCGEVAERGGGAGEGCGAGEEGAGEGGVVGCEHCAGGREFAVDLFGTTLGNSRG